jgi:phage-related protein
LYSSSGSESKITFLIALPVSSVRVPGCRGATAVGVGACFSFSSNILIAPLDAANVLCLFVRKSVATQEISPLWAVLEPYNEALEPHEIALTGAAPYDKYVIPSSTWVVKSTCSWTFRGEKGWRYRGRA